MILRYAYDPDGRLTNRWSAAKTNTVYAYDPVGNLTNINYPSSTDVVLRYDPLNRVTNMVDAVGTTKFTYAPGGQLWTEDGPFASDTVTNTYLNRLRVGVSLQHMVEGIRDGHATAVLCASIFHFARGLVSLHMEWSWGRELWSGLANAFLGVLVYALMDRVKQRT